MPSHDRTKDETQPQPADDEARVSSAIAPSRFRPWAEAIHVIIGRDPQMVDCCQDPSSTA